MANPNDLTLHGEGPLVPGDRRGEDMQPPPGGDSNPPMFNIPGPILILGGIIVAVHLVLTYLASHMQYFEALLRFSFIPASMLHADTLLPLPMAKYWTPITHGFLHGGWEHLIVNCVWLLAFGSAVARRFTSARFIIFMALSTAAGAGAHYLFHAMSTTPVIGASGAVSACMGAAIRFAFIPGRSTMESISQPALSLLQSVSNRQVMTFVGIWFALNWVFGSGIVALPGVGGSIAWEAHMGGFLFGWLAFSLFDPIGNQTSHR